MNQKEICHHSHTIYPPSNVLLSFSSTSLLSPPHFFKEQSHIIAGYNRHPDEGTQIRGDGQGKYRGKTGN